MHSELSSSQRPPATDLIGPSWPSIQHVIGSLPETLLNVDYARALNFRTLNP